MDERTRQIILSAQGAPASPYPELQKFHDINFQLPVSSAGVRVLTGQAEAQNAQQEFDVKQQIQKKDQGYTRQPKEDGGFAFFDPNGREVSAYEYARATGKTSAEVLSDSENPIDYQYIRDYENLQDFMDAVSRGDEKSLAAYYKENPALKNLAPKDVFRRFRDAYPTVYGSRNQGQPMGRTLIPNLQTIRDRISLGGGGVRD